MYVLLAICVSPWSFIQMSSDRLFSSGCPCARTRATPCPGDGFPVYSAISRTKGGDLHGEWFSFSTITEFANLPTGVNKQPSSPSRPHLPACALINVWVTQAWTPLVHNDCGVCAFVCLCKHMFMCHRFTMWTGITSPTLVLTLNCLPPPWPFV